VTDQINHLIAQSGKVAFEAGRQAERDLYARAIKWITTCDHIGDFVYLVDLEDTLADFRKEGK
jgi:hypothetical protein